MRYNYSQICSNLLKVLQKRQREVISRRFGLVASASDRKKAGRETLESIGKSFGISRERVRQIERDAFLNLKPELKEYQKVFQYFKGYLNGAGGVKKEDLLLENLAGRNSQNQVFFLLNLGEGFQRFAENSDLHSFWAVKPDSLAESQKIISLISDKLDKIGKPLKIKDLARKIGLNQKVLTSYLEISKKIERNSEDFWGRRDWPEINPRGIKDKAFLVFKKTQKPLHFTEVADLIQAALSQTVHNELIKDPRFVLVGRGLYALREWGYEEGVVKDVISKVLQGAKKPLSKEEILEKVLKQRLVKANTVLLNLSNRKYFSKKPGGYYAINTKEA